MRKVLAVTVAAAALTGSAALAVPAFAADASGTVFNTSGQNLNIRSTPSVHGAKVGKLHTGQKVKISCQTIGDRVQGPYHASNLWSYVDGRGYVSDAWIDTDAVSRIKGIPDCRKAAPKPAPAQPTQPTKPTPAKSSGIPADAMVVRQDQPANGQRRWHDCGPTSVVMAIRLDGRTPEGWPNEALAITKAREAMIPGPGMPATSTSAKHLRASLNHSGVRSHWTNDTNELMSAAAAGKTVILGGDAQQMRRHYAINVIPGRKVHHWIVVKGIDPATKEYGVLDPISKTEKVHRLDRGAIERFKHGGDDYRMGGVIVD